MMLCHKLKFSIERFGDPMGDEQVKLTLEDSLNLTKVELCCEINVTTPKSHRYHVQEAIVIGMRRLIDQAVQEGLIILMTTNSPGVQTNLNIPVTFPDELPPTGFMTEPDA